MLHTFKNGQGSVVLRVKLLDSSSTGGAGLTGLTSASSGLIVSTIADNEAAATTYTAAGSTIEGITTLGTYAAPTATKCRFKEVDATNHKGVYELQFADARFAVSGAKSLLVSIAGATNLAQADFVVQLQSDDPYVAKPTNYASLAIDGSGRVDASKLAGQTITAAAGVTFPSSVASPTNITAGTITTVTNLTNLPAITAGWITAAGIAAGAFNGKGDWNVGKTGYSLIQAFPANFSTMSITADGLVDMGASAVATAVWNAATAAYGSAGSYGLLIATNLDAQVSTVGGGSLTAAGIADAVWDELLPGHVISGSAGAGLSAAGSAGDPWSILVPGSYAAGTAGYIMGAMSTKINYLPSATAGAAGGLTIAGANAEMTVNITGNLTGNVTGSVGNVTTVSDKTGYSLSSAGVQAIWDALTSALTTVGSIGKRIADYLTGDAYARLGAPAGASHAADNAAIQADTTNIRTRLPAALAGGRMDSNLGAINGSTARLAAFDRAVAGNVIGTVGAGSTTTTIVSSALAPAGSVMTQFKGRNITFADNTTTAALRGQMTDITSSTASATPTFTEIGRAHV